jgi:hypothetical protein
MSWNADGLRLKRDDQALKTNFEKWDIVCIQETWSENKSDFQDWLTGYSVFTTEGTRRSKHGRCSGGVAVFVKESIQKHVTRINENCKFAVFLTLSNAYTGYLHDTLIVAAYLPPQGSLFYNKYDSGNGVELLQEEIVNVTVSTEYHLLLCGDFNARCGGLSDCIEDDGLEHIDESNDWYDKDDFNIKRDCQDKERNLYGQHLVEMCTTLNCHIMNGRMGSDKKGGFTCVTSRGRSTVDYIIGSSQLFSKVCDFNVQYNDICDEGMLHFPVNVKMTITSVEMHTDNVENSYVGVQYEKIRWCDEKGEVYLNNLKTCSEQDQWKGFHDLLEENNINEAVSCFESTLLYAASDMIVTPKVAKKTNVNKNVPWWDSELGMLKQNRNTCLTYYRQSGDVKDLSMYIKLRKEFKLAFKKKKKIHAKKMRDKLNECKNNSKDFWKFVSENGECKTKKNENNKISPEKWFQYFKSLLNEDVNCDEDFLSECEEDVKNHEDLCNMCDDVTLINREITVEEVKEAILSMKSGKSPGYDGLVIELFKKAVELLSENICKLFNKILTTGEYPESWSKAILCSIFKGGDVTQETNYRGISLLCTLGKVFTKILNQRLTEWAIKENKLYEEQTGYRKGYSTIDNIFSLFTVCQKYVSKKKGRFYVLFVDFSKAYDKIPHVLLWHRLIKTGVHGQILRVLQNMYSKLKSAVRLDGNMLTEWFNCTVGTRQGCMISPLMFTFYLNELIERVNNSEIRGIFVTEECPGLCMLCYADDIANCSDTVLQLQKQINEIHNFCIKYGMSVNLKKTKIIVFRNGGKIRKNERWFFGGEKIECVAIYKYLGFLFSSRLKWNKATEQLALQAQKALFKIYKLEKMCQGLSVKTYFELFDKMVVPILCYGSEVWGYEKCESIEIIHRKFCKRVLGSGYSASNAASLGECGRYPLMIVYYKRCILYWLKLLEMPENRISRQCYVMSKFLCDNGRKTWANDIKLLLNRYGFTYVWLQQGVGNKKEFITAFVQRVKDCYLQEWHETLSNSGTLNLYNKIKHVLEPEFYLQNIVNRKLVSKIAKLRTGNHGLNVQINRRNNNLSSYCQICLQNDVKEVEDEMHFVCKCTAYNQLRQYYFNI